MRCTTFGLSLFLCGTLCAEPPVQQTVREYKVPQPPLTVTEYVSVQRAIPQPPRTFREVTTTYAVETTPRAVAVYREVPVLRAAPVQVLYAVPAKAPVASYNTGLFGLQRYVVHADGTQTHYGPLGRQR